jgi:DNA-binding transcriptional LysR family regulator
VPFEGEEFRMATPRSEDRLSEAAMEILDQLISNKSTSQIDMETLALAVKAHYKPSQDVLTFLKEQRHLGKDSFYRRLGKFNEVFGQRQNKEFFRQLMFLLNVYHNLIEDRSTLKIKLGVSASFERFVRQKVNEPFLKWCSENPDQVPYESVQVEVDAEYPRTMRERGDRGELDLILTSCPLELTDGAVEEAFFKLQLVCIRDHDLTQRDLTRSAFEEIIHRTTLVCLEDIPERVPMPDYPDKLIDKAEHRTNVRSYHELHSRVRSSRKFAGFTFFEILGPEEQQELETVPIPDCNSKIRVCVLRPKKTREWRSAEETLVIDELERRLRQYLRELRNPLFMEDEIQRIPSEFFTYHVRPTRNNQWGWARGTMKLTFTQNGYVKGEHSVETVDGRRNAQHFDVFGDVLADPTKEFFQIVWQAQTGLGEVRPENYVASFLSRSGPLRTGYFVGTWSGRASYEFDAFRNATGYLVIRPKQTGKIEVAEKLSEIVELHEKDLGSLQMERPRVWANPDGRFPEE